MSDEESTPSSKPTGSVVLDNRQVFDLFMSEIDKKVNESIEKKSNQNIRNWIGILTIVVTILAASTAFVLKIYVENTADSAAEKIANEVRFNSEIAALNFRVLKLDLSDTITPDEARSIIEDVRFLISNKGDNRLNKLTFIIDTSMKNFAEANLFNFVLQLDDFADIAPDLFHSDIVIQTMLQAIGFTLLADAGAPTSWTDTIGSRRKVYDKYRTYADRAESSGHPELYLLYEMLLGYIEKRTEDEINNLIRNTDDLSEEDAEQFVRIMTALARGGIANTLTAKSDRAAGRVIAFLCEYKEQREILDKVFQGAKIQC